MKKLLLGATALTVVGVVGTASAQNVSTPRFDTTVGGFMTMGLGYVGSEATDVDDGNEFIVVNNAELIINFRLVADNGLTFGAKGEFEMNGQSNNVDEYVGFVSGSFGRIEVGAEDGAHDILVSGPVGGNFSAAADGGGFLFDYSTTGIVVPNTQGNDTGDGLKVTYYTPTISGFRAGISLAPNNTEGPVATPTTGQEGRGVELGAQYSNSFGDVSLFLAAGTTIFDEGASVAASAERDYSYTLNAKLGYAGFEVGAIWGVTEFNQGNENSALGLGAAYSTGPWFFGIQYGQNIEQRVAAAEDSMGLSGEVNYALAPGVTTGVVVEYASDSFKTSTIGNGNSDSAMAAGVFLGLSF